jgi:hypothetical protein
VILNHEPGAVDRMLTVLRSGALDQDIFRALPGLTVYREKYVAVFLFEFREDKSHKICPNGWMRSSISVGKSIA